MMRCIKIIALPTAKRKLIAIQRAKKLAARAATKLTYQLQNTNRMNIQSNAILEVDPINFARAFDVFRVDMALLSERQQLEFQHALRRYLSGDLDSEQWRHIVFKLGALRRVVF